MRTISTLIAFTLVVHGFSADKQPTKELTNDTKEPPKQETVFYHAPSKPSIAKQSHSEAMETTIQAITAMSVDQPGRSFTNDLQWVTITPAMWRNPEHIAPMSTFITTRLKYNGMLTALETTILSKALTAMGALPPTPATTELRRALQEFYDQGFFVDDLSVLEQRKEISELLHALCDREVEHVAFSHSAAAKRFERRKRYLQDIGAPASPIPQPPEPVNPF
jgi:hypothetical protein